VSQTLLAPDELDRRIRELEELLDDGSKDAVVRGLQEILSTYEPEARDAKN